MLPFKLSVAASAVVALLFTAAPSYAEVLHFKAQLTGASETPPNDSKGKGSVEATYDTTTRKLNWSVIYSDLTGPATMAHFHGPAAPGKAAGIEVTVPNAGTSPISGSATLTDAQAKDLMDGMMYFNVHTDMHKAGEIRGQVEKTM